MSDNTGIIFHEFLIRENVISQFIEMLTEHGSVVKEYDTYVALMKHSPRMYVTSAFPWNLDIRMGNAGWLAISKEWVKHISQ